ncbi:MAG TPA: hypothetical protein ENL08_00795, partial [Bacteroidetes bacterium]|nr:hypothetical protein [Bacteroidota bacterium]
MTASAGAADLPRIKLPDYIISGIEEATKVQGDRLPTSISSVVSSPEATKSVRPELTAQSVWTSQSKPEIINHLKRGYYRSTVYGGGFGAYGLDGGLVYAKPKVTRMGGAALNRSPHRITTGKASNRRIQYDEVHRFKGCVSIYPRAIYNLDRFQLLDSLDDHSAQRSDLTFDFFLNPWATSAGGFNGYISCYGWRYSSLEDLSGFSSRSDLRHNIRAGNGRLESELFFALENIHDDSDNLQLINLTSSYLFQPHQNLLVEGGGSFYAGKSVSGDQRGGVFPHLEAKVRLPVEGTLSLTYKPTVRFNDTRSILKEWRVLDAKARGTIAEEYNNLSLFYDRFITDDLEVKIGGFMTRSRHELFAVPDTSGEWFPVSRRLSSAGIRLTFDYNIDHLIHLQLHCRYANPRTSGAGPGDH